VPGTTFTPDESEKNERKRRKRGKKEFWKKEESKGRERECGD
jgi:hypothetical protein